MGDDFSNRPCYVGDRPGDAIRARIIEVNVNELKSPVVDVLESDSSWRNRSWRICS